MFWIPLTTTCIAILIAFNELSCSFRLLQDHSASTGVHSHALDTLKAKLEEAENKLKSEQEAQKKMEVCHYYKNTALTLQRLAIGLVGGLLSYMGYIGLCGSYIM